MDNKSKVCLYCSFWNQIDNDHAVGRCTVHDGYRLQYESCAYWSEGESRTPYREKSVGNKKERNRLRDDEVERHILAGCTREETRKIMRCDYAIIKAVVKERGLTVQKKPSVPKRQIITGEAYEQVVNYYKNERKSQRWIAQKLGYTLSAVRGALIRAGLAL